MKKIGMIAMVLGLLLVGCNDKKEKEEATKNKNVCDIDCEVADMSGYENFKEKDHVFLDITFEEANKRLQDENFTGILYFGFATCPWCIEAMPIMNEVAKADGLNIYYVNKKSEANEAHPEWLAETTKLLDDAYGLETNEETGELYLYVPEVVVVKEGKVIDHHMGTFDDHDAKERTMTTTEQKELKKIYETMFKKIQ